MTVKAPVDLVSQFTFSMCHHLTLITSEKTTDAQIQKSLVKQPNSSDTEGWLIILCSLRGRAWHRRSSRAQNDASSVSKHLVHVHNIQPSFRQPIAYRSSDVTPGMSGFVGYEFTKLYQHDCYGCVHEFNVNSSEMHSFRSVEGLQARNIPSFNCSLTVKNDWGGILSALCSLLYLHLGKHLFKVDLFLILKKCRIDNLLINTSYFIIF